ncbi:tetratricopeptide repeat protein [Actinacidiphila acididurans]|uniref:Sel1 repeat family protein n=1 Tax=Actinacidiphila acididurans TaxID=2784346 RepID=A0ABS2TLQ9_9ACTN|nr:sel1 repeat family protein [Actinacidiphila acididurans]MBM9503180.1 sel1 repeat family protein [Actinacidiphila acididurans]
MLERALPAPGPLRDLKDLLYELYAAAGAPSLDEMAADVAEDDDLPGAPSRDTIGRCISSPTLPPGQADAVAVAVVLARRARWDEDDAAARVRALWVEALMRVPVGRPIGEYDDRLVLDDLEVHPALSPAAPGTGLGALPAYVARRFDEELAEVVAAVVAGGRSDIAVLVGGSSTGKTRACWEAVRRLPDGWRLWHPVEPDPASALIGQLDRVAPQTVVWLNEAQHYLLDPEHGKQLASKLRTLLNAPDRGPVLILGTIWPEHWATLTSESSRGLDPHAQARQLVKNRSIVVPGVFTSEELAAARSSAATDSRMAEALQRAEQGQITQYLAGAPALIERYRAAPPAARALIEAAMDARRLGHGLALPRPLLETGAEGYLTDIEWDLLDDDWLEGALAYTSMPLRGTRGPLIRIRPRAGHRPESAQPAYRLADFLEQHGRQRRYGDRVPVAAWDALVRHAAPGDRVHLATAARNRGLLRIAMRFYAAADGDGTGRHEEWRLASALLKDAGRTEEWRTWHRRAVAADDDEAVHTEARILRETRGVDAALAWLQGAVDAGSLAAVRAMARMLKEEGRLQEALAWFLRDAQAGAPSALYIAQILEKLGRMDEALPWYHKSVEQGDSASLQWVARRLDAAGRREEALDWYLRAVDVTGGFLFIGRAAELMEKSHGTQAALAWLGERADQGDTNALGAAASLLTEAGRDEAAFAWLQERAEAGNAGALREVAAILKRAGQQAQALTYYDLAARAGDELAHMWGAEMLKLAGQDAEALTW